MTVTQFPSEIFQHIIGFLKKDQIKQVARKNKNINLRLLTIIVKKLQQKHKFYGENQKITPCMIKFYSKPSILKHLTTKKYLLLTYPIFR